MLGTKTLARGDFRKDVGTRVMRQSTLVSSRAAGYALSFTFIGGTEDDVEELIEGLRHFEDWRQARALASDEIPHWKTRHVILSEA